MARICVIDDSEESLLVVCKALRHDHHQVKSFSSPLKFLEGMIMEDPDMVILDIMMPEMDGIEVLRRIRATPELGSIKAVVLSAKSFEFDRKLAMDSGADGFIKKPVRDIKSFREEINRLLYQVFEVSFYGVRGTLPVPGENSLIYGGNTSCVSVRIPGKQHLIFDCGSGIKKLGDDLVRTKLEASIFITHAHWDHVNAFPFFTPLYVPGNKVHVFGPKSPGSSVKKMVSDQMSDIYFPITVQEFGGHLEYVDLHEEHFRIDGINCSTMLLQHPGNCLGYRLDFGGRSMCYITDNELYPEKSADYSHEYTEKLISFIGETDLLITDSTYTEREYFQKIGWGHSSCIEAAKLAHRAQVKKLCLFHHDPNQNDRAIEDKWRECCKYLISVGSSVECLSPKEGDTLEILSELVGPPEEKIKAVK